MRCVSLMVLLGAITTIEASAHAGLVGSYTVGSGSNSSKLQFDFGNSNTYLYDVRYDGSLHGNALLAIVAAAQPGFFAYQVQSYSFGDFLTGVTIGSDTDSGEGTPPDYLDYWHYWTKEPGGASWTESFIGFGDRTVSNGSWDGWVFNSAGEPAAVPAPGAIGLIACVGLVRRRAR